MSNELELNLSETIRRGTLAAKRIWFRTMVSVSGVVFSTVIVGSAAHATGSVKDSDVSPVLEQFASYCDRSIPIWGLTLCGPIIFVIPNSREAIANADPRLPDFKSDGRLWRGTLPTDTGVANTSVVLGGTRFAEILLPLPDDIVERRVLLSHESFHRIQPALGFKGAEADNRHLDSKDGRIYARLEIAALHVALTDPHGRKRAVRDALAYRAARLAIFSEAGPAEAALLASEGLAEYTGIRMALRRRPELLAANRLDSATQRASLIRSFGYVVGPAYGLLLDRTGKPWRRAALAGQPLPELLRHALNIKGKLTPRLGAYSGSAIVAEEVARDAKIQAHRSELVSNLVDGPTVTFPIEKMEIDFDPNSLLSLGDHGTVYSLATRIRDQWGELNISGDVLISSDWKFARVQGPAVRQGNTITGRGWSAVLRPGYDLALGLRAVDQTVVKAR